MCVSAEVTHSFKLRPTLWRFMFGYATTRGSVCPQTWASIIIESCYIRPAQRK